MVCSASLMFSCLGSNDEGEIDDWVLRNAQISSFSLSNDSIEGLSDVVFTIDQLNGQIYNKDSMPYGTVIDRKVMCNVQFDGYQSYISSITISDLAGDSIWQVADSVDISSPVLIKVIPNNELYMKSYEAWLNIHQVNPDSAVWTTYSGLIPGKSFEDMKVLSYEGEYFMYAKNGSSVELYKTKTPEQQNWVASELFDFPEDGLITQITQYEDKFYMTTESGNLYRSADGEAWQSSIDMPFIHTLLGTLPESETNNEPLLSGIVKEGETLYFAVMNGYASWTMGAPLPETFPLSGFSATSYELRYSPRLTIASGTDAKGRLSNGVWSTADGFSWAELTNGNAPFSPCKGAGILQYDNCLYFIGGIGSSGEAVNEAFHSKDNGITWTANTVLMPENYTKRGYSSLFVDEDNYILLFGGKAGENTNVLNELWKGRINRLGFEQD